MKRILLASILLLAVVAQSQQGPVIAPLRGTVGQRFTVITPGFALFRGIVRVNFVHVANLDHGIAVLTVHKTGRTAWGTFPDVLPGRYRAIVLRRGVTFEVGPVEIVAK